MALWSYFSNVQTCKLMQNQSQAKSIVSIEAGNVSDLQHATSDKEVQIAGFICERVPMITHRHLPIVFHGGPSRSLLDKIEVFPPSRVNDFATSQNLL